jgi:cytidylate kinase
MASLRLWIEADSTRRRQRFSERDRGKFDEYWGVWAAQEEEFYAAERSRELAELVIQN